MLTFVGLGLYDERSITLRGRDAIREADSVFAEFYTSRLAGATVEDLESAYGVDIAVRDRDGVERDPAPILEASANGDAAFLTAGDPLIATTHVDLRLRAHERGIETRIVHGVSAASAASGLTGLQNYRFGPSVTLPFPDDEDGVPDDPSPGVESNRCDGSAPAVPPSVIETIADNRARDLHTLVFLDIDASNDRFLTADRAAAALSRPLDDPLGVAVARAGSSNPRVRADRLSAVADCSFGSPLHLLVLPGDLHHMEAEALRTFADAPAAVIDTQ